MAVDLLNVAKNLAYTGAVAGYFSTGIPGESFYYFRMGQKGIAGNDGSPKYLFINASNELFKVDANDNELNHLERQEQATELEFLKWFYEETISSQEMAFQAEIMKMAFIYIVGKQLPEGYGLNE